MGWAGPSTTRTLADLGADVVKVESESHPDWWRGWEARTDADPPTIEIQPHFGAPVGGLYGVGAVLAALAGRDRLGGAIVDLSQVACLFQLGADAIVAAQVDGRVERTGNRRPGVSPCCVVPAAGDDEWLAVAVDGNEAWTALCGVVGRASWADSADLTTAADRDAHADGIEAVIAGWASGRPAREAAQLLQDAGVPAAPVQPAHSLGTDPHLVATGYWQELDRRYVGRHLLGGPPFRLDGQRPVARWSAPTLGEHTDDVLADPRWTETLGD